MSNKSSGSSTIILNKKARHDYFIEQHYEAGLELQGWEVKSLHAGKIQITESYILLKNNEAFLFGALITPLPTISTHFYADPRRNRKLLLHRDEINKLIGAVKRKDYTLITTAIYWKNGKAKLEVGVAKGKKEHDKRQTIKQRDWDRQKSRILRH